jgi:26S proteasome regulatory subunit T4
MRNVCTEAGLFAIRADRDYVLEEDFMKAALKILDNRAPRLIVQTTVTNNI